MKGYQFLVLLISINFILSGYCDSTVPEKPNKAEDCSSKKKDGGYCCLIKDKEGNNCGGLGPNQYKHIVDYVKYMRKCYPNDDGKDCSENKDYSIDCKSYYLVFSSLILLLLFL